MKVLQIASMFPPAPAYGGPSRVTYRVSKELAKRGYDVTVFTTDAYDAKSRFIVQKNPSNVDSIRVYRFRNLSNSLAYKSVPLAPSMAFALNKRIENYDLVHLREYRSAQAVMAHYYATKKNVPLILQPHGGLPTFDRILNRHRLRFAFDRVVGLRMLRDAHIVIASTESEAKQCSIMGVREGRIRIIPHGIDLENYANLPEKGAFREKFRIKKDDKIILYLGRISKIKGLDLLVDAFSLLFEQFKNAKLVIVGADRGYASDLKRRIQKLRISDHVLFTGPLIGNGKLEAYVDADVFVLPSIYESFSNVVLEASACGTPVIITDTCAIADFVRKYGVVVRYDAQDLADSLFWILNDDKRRREISKKGQDLVKKEFIWQKVIEEIEKTYQELISN